MSTCFTLVPRKLHQLSVVIPVYNEALTLPYLRNALCLWMERCAARCASIEIVLVNDGSNDASLNLLQDWAEADPRIKVLSFSRNFGHQAAATAGLRAAQGDAVVLIDADLQDPLDVIFSMIDRYEEGYDVAYGVRTHRGGESPFKLGTAWLFYRIMRACVHKDLPLDAGDFRLVSRQCLDVVNAMPESHRFLRGLFAWSGFAQIAVPYERHARQYGETKYPFYKMLVFAWEAVTSFSALPMRLVYWCGLGIGTFGFLYTVYAIRQHFLGHTVQGWTTLICLISLIGGMTLFGLGILGEYVARMYEEIKGRPQYIIQRTFNVQQKNDNNTNHTKTKS